MFLKNHRLILILILTGVLLLTTNTVLAIQKCQVKNNSPQCPSSGSIKLQVGVPYLGESCQYDVIYYEKGQRMTSTKTLHCVAGFAQYVKGIYNFFISVVGILAVIMIMVGGFQWLLAAGNAQKITGAKTRIISAIIGLVLTLGTYSILHWINPALTELKPIKPIQIKLSDAPTIGLCTKAMKAFVKFGEEAPKCGQVYLLDEKDKKGDYKKCTGFAVGLGQVCYTNDNGQTTKKTSELSIRDERSDGFGFKTWYIDHGINERKCGFLYVKPTLPTGSWAYYLGGMCGNLTKEHCLIDQSNKDGVEWSKTPKEAGNFWNTLVGSWFKKNGVEVGKLENQKNFCREYK